MAEEIVNKVAKSGLITLDLGELAPKADIVSFDLAEHLWQGLVLKEQDFRDMIKTHDWSQYQDQHVAVFCSADAIVQDWAYMLVASALQPYAKRVEIETPEAFRSMLFLDVIRALKPDEYRDARLVVKGCGDVKVPPAAFAAVVSHLQPVVKALMYGEPCSTVPVYKRK
ncbi:MAG: DUF2480 family protein [Cryomorphaceae bacterium]|nr:MAG: DUF2480 family protein [Cryomorphaceae bacterium]